MPITVELQGMHSYTVLMLIISIVVMVLLAISIVVIIFLKRKSTKNDRTVVVPKVHVIDKQAVKRKYIAMLVDLDKKCREDKISNRHAYNELSKITRRFVYEATGIKVHHYTLEEIRRSNMPDLYYMIEECYAPEFAKDKKGEIFNSISRSRKVIEEWN